MMNTVDKIKSKNATIQPVAASYLSSNHHIEVIVRTSWRLFCSEISELSIGAQVLTEYVKERTRDTSILPLNAHIPCLIGSALGITDSILLQKATKAHLYLDAFTQFLDDVADKQNEKSIRSHIACELLAIGIGQMMELNQGNHTIPFIVINDAITKAMKAERSLWSCRTNLHTYTDEESLLIANRGGVLLAITRALAYSTGQLAILPSLEKAILNGALAIQLVDDVLDWEEDYQARIFTPILCKALNGNSHNLHKLNTEKLAAQIISTKAASSVIEIASEALINGRRHLAVLSDRRLFNLYEGLNMQMKKLQSEIVKVEELSEKNWTHSKLTAAIKKGSDTRLAH